MSAETNARRWAEARQKAHQSLTLVVGRRRTKSEMENAPDDLSYELSKVRQHDTVADTFRHLCEHAIDRIESADIKDYGSTAELDKDDIFVLDGSDDLDELADFRHAANAAGTSTPIAPEDLDTRILFYGAVVGDRDRIIFVRKANPQLHHRSSRVLASGRHTLTAVDGPLFSFATTFDFVLASDWAVVLYQHRFEQLFREAGLVEKHVEGWVGGVTKYLPMAEGSSEALRDAASRDPRLWRRLRAISKRGHLRNVGIAEVRRYAESMELDVDKIIKDDELIFDPGERFTIMELLNEDLFRGPMSDEVFESQRKAPAD